MAGQKTILLVEDDAALAAPLAAGLEAGGFAVVQAGDGEEGLAKARDVHPDLILLDIVMPVMDGMSMLKNLREEQWGARADVILLTNLGDTEKVAEAMMYGTFDYLVKTDHSVEEVVALVKKKLGG